MVEMLDGGEVLCRGRLHETSHVSDDKGYVKPDVHKLAEATNHPSVEGGVSGWAQDLLAQLEAWLHGDVHWIALLHGRFVQKLARVHALWQSNHGAALVDLDLKVIAEDS